MIWISIVFKVARLLVIIGILAYYFGTLFFIFADITSDNHKIHANEEGIEHYIEAYDLKDHNDVSLIIMNTYFAFTSLTTVGFGDLHPKSNVERLFVAAGLLLGVLIFSFIQGELNEILVQMTEINSPINDGDSLSMFFGLLKQRYNYDRPIKQEIIDNIHDFFEYKWKKDSNQAISTDEERELLQQLPFSV